MAQWNFPYAISGDWSRQRANLIAAGRMPGVVILNMRQNAGEVCTR